MGDLTAGSNGIQMQMSKLTCDLIGGELMSTFPSHIIGQKLSSPSSPQLPKKYINEDTFIDFFILNELSNNLDGYRLSTYLTKDRGKKLKIGPIWDFNLSFGNGDYCGGNRFDVWSYKFNDRCPGDNWNIPFWWDRLLEDEAFVIKLKDRWNELRTNILSNENILSLVDSDYSFLKNETDAADKNFNRWKIFGIYIWPNSFIGNSYYEEINFLKEWISYRTSWLDESINSL